MGKLNLSHHITDCIDSVDTRLEEIIHHDPAVLHPDRHIRIEQPFRIRRPSYGYQHSVHFRLLILSVVYIPAA